MDKTALLIVDDDPHIRAGIMRFLRKAELTILQASSAEEAKALLKNNTVGVLIADHQMAGISGLELLRWARINNPDTVRVMLTGHSSVDLMQEVINSGEVYRFITKPWENDQLKDVIESCFKHYEHVSLQRHLESLREEQEKALKQLEMRFQQAWKELHENRQTLKDSRLEAIQALAKAVDAKDPYTHGHMERVSDVALKIAQTLDLPVDQRDAIQMAGLLHDVGKIGVPDNVLFYVGKMTDAEWAIIKLHPEMGGRILDPIKFSWNLRELIEAHHERYDGAGYPRGLKGEEIPLGSRILAVADSYDAMAHERRYRPALPNDLIVKEIEENLGTQFDPVVGEVFLNLMRAGKIHTPTADNSGSLNSGCSRKSSEMEGGHV